MLRTSLMCGAAVLSVAVLASETHAGTIQEPPLFASQNGVLDLLVIAAPQRVTNFTQPGFTQIGGQCRRHGERRIGQCHSAETQLPHCMERQRGQFRSGKGKDARRRCHVDLRVACRENGACHPDQTNRGA